MVAGVFSRCMLAKSGGSDIPDNCCVDPVVYERINEEIKNWIWKTAPGVRESIGCQKKEIKSILYQLLLQNIIFLFLATPRTWVAGCRCGVERKFYDYNRIVGGEKIGRDKVCMDLICMAFIMYNVRNIFLLSTL